MSGRIIRTSSTIGLLLSAVLARGISAAAPRPSQPPEKGQTKLPSIQIGDVDIHYNHMVKSDLSHIHVSGRDLMVTMPDRKTGARLKLHSDDLVAIAVDGRPAEFIEMTGNVNFTIVQRLKSGTRLLAGRSAHATFDRAGHILVLDGSAHLTITDPASLDKPGEISAGKITAELSTEPFRYTLTGTPSEDEIIVTPLKPAAPADAKASPKAYLKETHVTRFVSATLIPQQSIECSGEQSVIDAVTSDRGGNLHLRAPHFRIDSGKAGVESVGASGGVHFTSSRIGGSGAVQSVVGDADKASFSTGAGAIRLDGGVFVTISDADLFDTPAVVHAEHALMRTDQPLTGELRGNRQTTSLRFVLRRPPAKPGAPPSRFDYRDVAVTHFASAEITKGAKLVCSGAGTVFLSTDLTSHSTVQFETPHLEAALKDKTITDARATDGVRYQYSAPKSAKHSARTVNGRAVSAVMTPTADGKSIAISGPGSATVIDPDQFEGPGTITWLQGDSFDLDLTQDDYKMSFDSPNGTATIQFTPKVREHDPNPASGAPKAH